MISNLIKLLTTPTSHTYILLQICYIMPHNNYEIMHQRYCLCLLHLSIYRLNTYQFYYVQVYL